MKSAIRERNRCCMRGGEAVCFWMYDGVLFENLGRPDRPERGICLVRLVTCGFVCFLSAEFSGVVRGLLC